MIEGSILSGDLRDGTKLAELLIALTGEKIKYRSRKKCKMEVHELENLGTCIDFVKAKLKEKGAKPLVNVGGRDIYEGHERIILGLVWKLILEFQVADIDIDGISGKKGLLEWVKRVTADYNLKCKMKNVRDLTAYSLVVGSNHIVE